MKYHIFLFLFFMSCTSSKKITSSSGGNAKRYRLIWSDEFKKNGLPDSTKWGFDTGGGGWGNNELEYYTKARPENARVLNGKLIIDARKENMGGRNYTSARLLTKNKAQWTYGRFDIRAKLPMGRGIWPAIWLLAANDPMDWPGDGEIDIMEAVGFNPNVIHGTVHNKMYYGGTAKGGSTPVPDADKAFHVYSIEWTTKRIVWLIDNVPYFTYTDPGSGKDAWPYYSDFFIILNAAVGGNWGGQKGVDDMAFPQQMFVDYVRVYQEK